MSTASNTCPIWGTPADRQITEGRYAVESSRAGGAYLIDMDAVDSAQSLRDEAKARLTTTLIDRRQQGDNEPLVTRKSIDAASSNSPLPVYERAGRLLKYLTTSIPIGSSANLKCNDDFVLAISESFALEEVIQFLKHLEQNGWIECQYFFGGSARCTINVDGYGVVEQFDKQLSVSQAFVAMWLDDETEGVYETGISKAITDTGYKDYRVDKGIVHSSDAGKIDDTIIAEIRRSRFVVADFTHGEKGIRGSVYYEAGFAHGLGIPVVYSCRQDQIKELHFDTRQYYHIAWATPEELREALEKRILAMVGEGPLKNGLPQQAVESVDAHGAD